MARERSSKQVWTASRWAYKQPLCRFFLKTSYGFFSAYYYFQCRGQDLEPTCSPPALATCIPTVCAPYVVQFSPHTRVWQPICLETCVQHACRPLNAEVQVPCTHIWFVLGFFFPFFEEATVMIGKGMNIQCKPKRLYTMMISQCKHPHLPMKRSYRTPMHILSICTLLFTETMWLAKSHTRQSPRIYTMQLWPFSLNIYLSHSNATHRANYPSFWRQLQFASALSFILTNSALLIVCGLASTFLTKDADSSYNRISPWDAQQIVNL